MGRHSRKDSAPPRPVHGDQGGPDPASAHPEAAAAGPLSGSARRHRPEPAAGHQEYANEPAPAARAGHPEIHEPGGAYGDWRAVPRSHPAPSPAPGVPAQAPAPAAYGSTAPYGSPAPAPAAAAYRAAVATAAAVFPEAEAPDTAVFPEAEAPRAAVPGAGSAHPARGAGGGAPTGSHRRVPPPRRGSRSTPAKRSAATRGRKVRTYTGMAAAAVTTVLAVVVAGQVVGEDGGSHLGVQSAGDTAADRAAPGQSAASRSDGRATPDAPAVGGGQQAVVKTYEQKMADPYPIAANLAGPGTFDTVATGAPAPGKGRLVRYRVDVEQGLGLDADLFAEAVQRTLNDPRSWAHDGDMRFERVASGTADFAITLASPGTTGVWCAKSSLDTTVDNVSCDSASTERVMINAFRWAQGSPTYGQDQMYAYRQMLINHEVGHRLGHDHVSCRTPGALAPIMQQQTKSLDIDGISCKPNPWVYPTS
ncbi:DUF3152 domain-containing protein [Streptomyces sp. NPDC051555]|uniref:DUF3152 domain-containing protein n=1 Tax=Streptomyces sp. NPDC051555 TaxID=3365657 RepID=UPI0037B65BD9